jgi:AraC family transcriptional regulator, regulatory protein of adaptative response / DNA-3-methyladenine glycosylase II
MLLSPTACYQAMKTRDSRFDGHFFVAVSSTKIYCRPVCRVRIPMFKNCGFHPSAAAAEIAGFRPCLKCRPELAPGFSVIEASRKLAHAALHMIEDGAANEQNLAELARRIGVTDRHLRRIFADEFGVSPVQFAQTRRLLLAKRFLTDTTMPISKVAQASGFSSVRRMNALFTQRYRFAPTRLRKQTGTKIAVSPDAFKFYLGYRPPYEWSEILKFLSRRAIPDVESVDAQEYRRVIRFATPDGSKKAPPLTGWISVRDAKASHCLEIAVSTEFESVLPQVIAQIARVFDVNAAPLEISDALGALAETTPGLRLPGAFDGFELAVRAVLGQQVTVKAARTLAMRFVAAFGEPASFQCVPPFADLNRAFPTTTRIATLSQDDIGSLGIVSARANAIIAIARKIENDELDLSSQVNPGNTHVDATIAALQSIKGIGPWTAHYVTMRALSWPDAWPPQDVALLKAMNLPNTAIGQRAADERAKPWQPWRSYAVLHLWNSLEQTK